MSIAQLLTTASIMKGQMESQHYLRFRRFGPNFFGPMGDLGASPEEVAPFFLRICGTYPLIFHLTSDHFSCSIDLAKDILSHYGSRPLQNTGCKF